MAFSVLVITTNVSGSIQIGIQLETTMLALEQTLLDSISPRNVSTARASLRGITSIDMTDSTILESSFVSQECFELEKRPTVHKKPLLLPELLAAVSDVCQVFKHERGSRRKAIHNPFRDDMVHVSPETVLLHSQFLKVPFGRTCSPGLQYLSQVPVPIYDSFYFFSSKELVVGSDCNFVDASVNADDNARRFDVWNVFLENDSDENLLASNKQFRRFSSPVFVLLKIGRRLESEFLSTGNGGDRKHVSVEPYCVGVVIIPDTGLLGNRTGRFTFISDFGFDAFQCFGCFVPSRARELRREKRFAMPVGFIVKRDCVAVVVFPADSTDVVERFGVCLNGRHDRIGVCFEFDFDCLN